MPAKLSALILSLGFVACLLLGLRQLRNQAAHEMANVQKRVLVHDKELWKLRCEIAHRISPDKVQELCRSFGTLEPVSAERYRALVRLEAEAAGMTTYAMRP